MTIKLTVMVSPTFRRVKTSKTHAETSEIPFLSSFSSPVRVWNKHISWNMRLRCKKSLAKLHFLAVTDPPILQKGGQPYAYILVSPPPVFARVCGFITSSICNTYYRKRGSASYIVREVLLVRERERERERDTERERKTEVTSPFSR